MDCYHYANDTQLNLLIDGQPYSSPYVLVKALNAGAGWLWQSQTKSIPSKTEVLHLRCGGLEVGT